MANINFTEGNDVTLNATLMRDGEVFPVELSEEVHAEVVSRIGGRTSCGCEVTDVGMVLVDVPGSLLPGGYIVAVYGVLDGAKWRSACRGLLVTRVTEGTSEKAESIVSDGDVYDITMEVQMYKADVPGAIAAHNQDKTAHADIRELIPTLPKHIVTDADYVHTDNNYTNEEKEKLRGLANYDDAEVRGLIAQKQDVISDLAAIRSGAEEGASAYQKAATIENLIPAQASANNKLADVNFVNSSVETNTATFRGTYNLVSQLSLTVSATQAQIAAVLNTTVQVKDNNDYVFVLIPTADATPTEISRVDRYKYNGSTFAYEWSLNNSSFTAVQWAALNSGITSGLVEKLNLLPTLVQLNSLLNGKVDAVQGKGLSTNDYTNEEKNKLAGLSNYNDAALRALIGGKQDKTSVVPVVFPAAGSAAPEEEIETVTLFPNTIVEATFVDRMAFTFNIPYNNEKCEYCLKFDVGNSVPSLNLEEEISWAEALTLEANKHYVIVVTYECGALYGDWKSYPVIEQQEEEEEA